MVTGSRSARVASGRPPPGQASPVADASSVGCSATPDRPASPAETAARRAGPRDQADHVPPSSRNTWWRPGSVSLPRRGLHHRPALELDQLVHPAQRRRVGTGDQARPTPNPSIGAPAAISSAIRYSSRSPEPTIPVPTSPAASSTARTPSDNSSRSPESIRTACGVTPVARPQHRLAGTRERLVGVDHERRAVGMVVQERAERIQLGRKREHVAVGHRAGGGDAPETAGLDGRGGGHAADVGAARRQQAGVGAVCPAKAEVHHRPARGGVDDPSRLGSDHGRVR